MRNRELDIRNSIFEPEELHPGIEEEILQRFMGQVAGLIDQDREEHPGVMLSQNPGELMTQFRNGRSSVMVSGGNPGSRLIAHGTIWPLEEVRGVKLSEIGSVIVSPEYRNRGVSRQVVGGLLRRRESNELLITTTKDIRMGRALKGGGLMPVDFDNYPEITRATCVCPSLELNGRCNYRRFSEQCNDEVFRDLFDSQGRRKGTLMECTLFISDRQLAERFEKESGG